MRIGRRGFLGLLGGAAAALATAPAVEAAAPLFIPSDRLEMGVPKLPASLRAPQTVNSGLVLVEQPLPPSLGEIDPFWDDSPWLQARMDAAALDGGFVHIPPGIYELGRPPLVVPNGVGLHVEDAVFTYYGRVAISIAGDSDTVIRNNWFRPAKGHSGFPIEVRMPKAERIEGLTLLTDDDIRRARRRLAD